MAIKKKVYTIFANRLHPECKLYFLNNRRGYHPSTINIPKYYFFAPMHKKWRYRNRGDDILVVYYRKSAITLYNVFFFFYICCVCTFTLYYFLTFAKSPLHCIMFLSSLIYVVMGISFATALRFGALLICTQSVINLEPC